MLLVETIRATPNATLEAGDNLGHSCSTDYMRDGVAAPACTMSLPTRIAAMSTFKAQIGA
jgi:hypothetical protein